MTAGLIVNTAITDATDYTRGYADYPIWIHIVTGIAVLGSMLAALIVFVIYPGALVACLCNALPVHSRWCRCSR